MNRLQRLYDEFGQSPWLDNLKRGYLTSGELARLIGDGIRGLTSNPTILQRAIEGSPDYDAQLAELAAKHVGGMDRYWELVLADINGALDVFAELHERSGGADGFVSVEVTPDLAHDSAGTLASARSLNQQINKPNLLVKIPATAEGVAPIRDMTAEGRSVNVTLIFSLTRYADVIGAYLDGLETFAADPAADLSKVHGIGSFFVSRVDTEVDRRLEAIGTPEALALRGKAAIAQAKLAYKLFRDKFSGPRWEALAARGARLQRPLWASTSTKNPAYPDTVYVDNLIGPDTVNTLPDATIAAFSDHGTLARTIDAGLDEAEEVWATLPKIGIDMEDVADKLEREGIAAFQKSIDELLGALAAKIG